MCRVIRPSLQPVRTLPTASPRYPKVLQPALASGVPWPQTPLPRSTAVASESKRAHLSHTCDNQECWYRWTMLEPSASERPVLVPVDRVVFVSRPVECSADAAHIVPALPKCMPVVTDHALSSCILSCSPIVPAHPCLTDAFKASKDFSDQAPPPQLWTPAHSSLRPLHVKLPIVASSNHKAARGKYDGLIQSG